MGIHTQGLSTAEVDGTTIEKNASNQLSVKEDGLIVSDVTNEHELEIIELQANSTITPLDHDSIVSETYSDSDGYNGYRTGGTATFDTNKYKRLDALTFSHGQTQDGSATKDQLRGVQITVSENQTLTKITKHASCTATKAYIYSDDGADAPDSQIATADFSGADATFNQALTANTKYWLLVDSAGGNYTARFGSATFPITNDIASFNKSYEIGGVGSITNSIVEIASFTGSGDSTTPRTIVHTLPTITGTITHTQLVIDSPESESGSSVTYDIGDGSTSDTDQAVDTKNTYSPTGAPTTLTLNLKPKSSSPTAGHPSVKSWALKMWKA